MADPSTGPRFSRRQALTTGVVLGAGATFCTQANAKGSRSVTEPPVTFGPRPRPGKHVGPITVGSLVFPRLDQIDFSGPFEVFARMPDAKIEIIAKTMQPVADVKGLKVTPTMRIADAPLFDVLHVAGGLGQQAIMDDDVIIPLIKRHADAGRLVFSVCTGALLCGAAGVLEGRWATTHWAALGLLRYYGAHAVQSRVVVDGNYVSTAGVTAGLDGALVVASLLRGEKVAEEIQLDIEYAPNPVFHSGTLQDADGDVIAAFWETYGLNRQARANEAHRFAAKLGVKVQPGL